MNNPHPSRVLLCAFLFGTSYYIAASAAALSASISISGGDTDRHLPTPPNGMTAITVSPDEDRRCTGCHHFQERRVSGTHPSDTFRISRMLAAWGE
jgi:hypothetical protein